MDKIESLQLPEQLSELFKLVELSMKDSHTGLYNYRYLMERLTIEVQRARRHIFSLSVLMLDVDYLKVINDVYGHQYADTILKELGAYLKDSTRAVDILARYGGDEFVVVLPDTHRDDARRLAERLLEGINQHTFDEQGKKIKLKISIGLANFPLDGREAASASGLIHCADQALLNAKKTGKNKLCVFQDINKDTGAMKENDTISVEALKEKLCAMADHADHAFMEGIRVFVKTIKARDHYADEHIEHMVSMVAKMAQAMGLGDQDVKTLKQAALLHDLGKVAVPDDILQKKGKLSREEYEIIKKHPLIGAEIIKSIYFLDKAVPSILYHHERFDGLGYPMGLKGKEIPLGARIIGIADVYEALISDRPYRSAYSPKQALAMIRESASKQFDPGLVDVFLRVVSS